ncbi:MAG: AMP-binding protein [Candidatus Krumholzibacteria bacterium]|nr:AMP-binding protein [Candidatus Krumholzibacteria bacterium]
MSQTKFVHSFLEDSAGLYAGKNAFFAFDKWHTFGELNATANRLAHLLLKSGLAKGDRVGILIENSMEYVSTYYGVLKAGGITVALNTDNTADDVGYIIKDCGVRFLVASEKLMRRMRSLFEGRSSGQSPVPGSLSERIFVWATSGAGGIEGSCVGMIALPAAMEAEPASNPGARMIDIDIASIVYTSGSTGKPRGAVLSHLNIVSNTRSIVDYLALTPEDRIMVVLPFYYIYGKSLLNTHFCAGGSVVVDNRFMYPNVILETMKNQEVTGFAGVPSTFTILLGRSNVREQRFKTLRYVTQAGGAMAPAVQKQVAEVFAPAKLFIMYGATEASARLSYLDPADLPRKWGSIGKGIPNVDLFVADQCGNPLGVGEEGEIVARGSNLMSGYWNHPEETEKVLKYGLYYTGDIGRMDEEGFIFVVGRSKDIIKIGGNRVSAKEIEEALYEHPAIHEAAVIGIPDDVLGEAPKACIVLKSGYCGNIEEELGAFLKDHLASYKIPKCYEIHDSLPKNESGKIQKLKLK